MKDTIVINLFAGPGSGKSTFCASIFSKLKMKDIDCEMSLEYAKDLVWEESFKKMDSQLYLFGKQFHRLNRLLGKVDVVITDSPLLLSPMYDKDQNPTFRKLVVEEHRKINTMNFFIERKKKYNPNGRMQTLEEAVAIDNKLKSFLNENNIIFKSIQGDVEGIDEIVDEILSSKFPKYRNIVA